MPLNKPSPRLAILRAQFAAKAADEEFARALYSYSAQNPRTLRALPPLADSMPLPPSYDEDLEHWLQTLAPAKPAATGDAYVSAKQTEPAAEVWHSETPSVAGVYIASADRCREVMSYWDGKKWHCGAGNPSDARKKEPRNSFPIEWLRLIEADKPTQQPAQKASTRHVVCIKSHICEVTDIIVAVGQVAPAMGVHEMQQPVSWLPCDESGWVTHVPTADAVCPVPEGVDHKTKRRCGDIFGSDCSTSLAWQLGNEERRVPHEDDIIAWRPIAQS